MLGHSNTVNHLCQKKYQTDHGLKMELVCLHTYKRQNYIVTVDYYLNFIEMDKLRDTSSRTTIKVLKTHFLRHGIPDVLVSDNGPQYVSE